MKKRDSSILPDPFDIYVQCGGENLYQKDIQSVRNDNQPTENLIYCYMLSIVKYENVSCKVLPVNIALNIITKTIMSEL